MTPLLAAALAAALQHQGHAGMDMPMPPPAPPAGQAPAAPPDDGSIVVADTRETPGSLGSYAITREASGTSWQPDISDHRGVHVMAGDWMLMGHALLNLVFDRQEGPRGGDKAFVLGMVMGSARRPLGSGTLQLRAMLSPEPLMGPRGYPLLLASGETADGLTTLVDRQHPHDLFMELSASYSVRLAYATSAFVYAGLPGEPAFGPPAFMHRLSIMDSPEAPISHHWLDSTHIAFGVATVGLVHGNMKVEASRFNGREPDQYRWGIETGPLDSTALRLSWNPTDRLAVQASWGRFVGPEQLEPGENQTRWSASAIWTRPIYDGSWSTTLAWGRRSTAGRTLDAFVLESALRRERWTVFGRAEETENDELTGIHHGPVYGVGKASIGAIRDFQVAPHAALGLGALVAQNFVPRTLRPSYGGDAGGFMAFVRLKVD